MGKDVKKGPPSLRFFLFPIPFSRPPSVPSPVCGGLSCAPWVSGVSLPKGEVCFFPRHFSCRFLPCFFVKKLVRLFSSNIPLFLFPDNLPSPPPSPYPFFWGFLGGTRHSIGKDMQPLHPTFERGLKMQNRPILNLFYKT